MAVMLSMALDTNTNQLTHIYDVAKENKSSYDFICPECKEKLIPRIGEVNQPHFAHGKNSKCTMNGESSIHMVAKHILKQNNRIIFPIYNPVTLEWQKIEREYKFIELEKKYEDIIPDIVIEIEGRLVFIEVAYTHFIDEEKHEKLKRIGIETWEINLKDCSDTFDNKQIKKHLLKDTYNKMPFVLDTKNYSNELNKKCKEFKMRKIQYVNKVNYIDYAWVYQQLVEQYKKYKDYTLENAYILHSNKMCPIPQGDTILRIAYPRNYGEVFIRLYRRMCYSDTISIYLATCEEHKNHELGYLRIHKDGYKLYCQNSTCFVSLGTIETILMDLTKILNNNFVNCEWQNILTEIYSPIDYSNIKNKRKKLLTKLNKKGYV